MRMRTLARVRGEEGGKERMLPHVHGGALRVLASFMQGDGGGMQRRNATSLRASIPLPAPVPRVSQETGDVTEVSARPRIHRECFVRSPPRMQHMVGVSRAGSRDGVS